MNKLIDVSIISNEAGWVKFEDLTPGETIFPSRRTIVIECRDGQQRFLPGECWLVRQAKSNKKRSGHYPQIVLNDANGKAIDVHFLCTGCILWVSDGQWVEPGDTLAVRRMKFSEFLRHQAAKERAERQLAEWEHNIQLIRLLKASNLELRELIRQLQSK